ncbi:MAG: AI-2E family transporter [Bacteroidales bacterium]|nr:AI-2E family transporter [Bacteroidales bacterium]
METMRWTDKLAKYTVYLAMTVVICAFLWYFRNVVVYILVAGVLSIIGKPLCEAIKRLHIKSVHVPDWLASILTLVIIFGIFAAFVTLIVPVVGKLVSEISTVSLNLQSIAAPLEEFNRFMASTFPSLGSDFRIETVLTEEVQKILNVNAFSSMISSVTTFLTNVAIALFSIIFISFFFFKDGNLFTKMITALVPDKSEDDAKTALSDIGRLLTRYFVGLLVEIIGVGLLNFLGLALIAKLDVNTAVSIAAFTGILNVIPYIGPIFGGVLGTVLALLVKYSSAGVGLDVSFWVFVLILVAVFCITQIIDNYLYKTVIFSNSIKAHPLEIFVVTIMAGALGGMVGMLVAIPCYTMLRVIAGRFFRNVKFVRRLISPDGTNVAKAEDSEKTEQDK